MRPTSLLLALLLALAGQSDGGDFRMETRSKPTVNVEDKKSYVQAICEHTTGLFDVKFHRNFRMDEAVGPPLENMGDADDPKHYFVGRKKRWYRCSGVNSEGVRLYSDPKPLSANMPTIDIVVRGATFKGRAAKLSGEPTEIVCKVNNTDPKVVTTRTVKLEYDGTIQAFRPFNRKGFEFQFDFSKPLAATHTGNYRCVVDTNEDEHRIKSGRLLLSWCNADQFVCDGKCQNKTVKCDRKNDCEDGTDELPSVCNPCEPNEVPCGKWWNKSPTRRCVLKHRLCDGVDNCGNLYDEFSPVAIEWCQPNCLGKSDCFVREVCCGQQGKCIFRAYECDRENDCEGGDDEGEEKCCTLDVVEPSRAVAQNATSGSKVTLTCRALGFERPTINWRCDWGPLRDPGRMKETLVVRNRTSSGIYEVVGTLAINNFTSADRCTYNCEAVTKCKTAYSPDININVL